MVPRSTADDGCTFRNSHNKSRSLEDLPSETLLQVFAYLPDIDLVCLALTSRHFYRLIQTFTRQKHLKQLIPRKINYHEGEPFSYGPIQFAPGQAWIYEGWDSQEDTMVMWPSIGHYDATTYQTLMIRLDDWFPKRYVLCNRGQDTYVREEKESWVCEKCEEEGRVPFRWLHS